MTLEEAAHCRFNPFDVTKVWPHAEYPLQEVGRMVLNRNPTNYFAEVSLLSRTRLEARGRDPIG